MSYDKLRYICNVCDFDEIHSNDSEAAHHHKLLTQRKKCEGVLIWHSIPPDPINSPSHYGGADNPYEAIKVIEAWNLGFHLGNCLKYISRAGKKGSRLEDLEKAQWYLDREIENEKKEQTTSEQNPHTAATDSGTRECTKG